MADALLALLRLAHALSAALWLGALAVYLLAGSPPLSARTIWQPLREALVGTLAIFVVSGAILMVDRLSAAALPPTYMGLLALKIGAGFGAVALAARIGRGPHPASGWRQPAMQALALLLVAYAAAVGLRTIFEQALR